MQLTIFIQHPKQFTICNLTNFLEKNLTMWLLRVSTDLMGYNQSHNLIYLFIKYSKQFQVHKKCKYWVVGETEQRRVISNTDVCWWDQTWSWRNGKPSIEYPVKEWYIRTLVNRNTKITQIAYGMNNFHPYDLYSFNFLGGREECEDNPIQYCRSKFSSIYSRVKVMLYWNTLWEML